MDIVLRAVQFRDVSDYFVDFQKKSHCFEIPNDYTEYIGIFGDNALIGYFITQGYNYEVLEIQQGYLLPNFRHKDLPRHCLELLEDMSRSAGYKRIELCTQNRFRSYLRFMKDMGYTPVKLIFAKEV